MNYSNLIKNARDIDTKKGIVSFYFADFNSVDTHGRRMNKTAFNRTLKNNFKRFAHLLNHDTNLMIGKPVEVGVDEKGAFMISQLSKNSAGRDALVMYEEGMITEHSFGFKIVDSVQDGKVEVVNELQMFEASSVTWGANENTPTISLNSNDTLIKELQITNKEILTMLSDISARLPGTSHQDPPTDIDDILAFINDKY